MLTSPQKLGFLDLTLKAFRRLYRTIRLHRQSFHLSLKLNKLSSISMMIGSFHSFQKQIFILISVGYLPLAGLLLFKNDRQLLFGRVVCTKWFIKQVKRGLCKHLADTSIPLRLFVCSIREKRTAYILYSTNSVELTRTS